MAIAITVPDAKVIKVESMPYDTYFWSTNITKMGGISARKFANKEDNIKSIAIRLDENILFKILFILEPLVYSIRYL